MINLNKHAYIFSNADEQKLNSTIYEIIVHHTFLSKHAALVRKDEGNFQIIDLCANETLVCQADGNFVQLVPLQYYDINHGDRILIGTFEFEYKINEKEESDSITAPKKCGKILVPDSEDFLSDNLSDTFKSTDSSDRPEVDIEIPNTQDILSQDILSNFDEAKPLKENIDQTQLPLMETKSFSDDISCDVKMKQEDSPMDFKFTEEVQDLGAETQPFIPAIPKTRSFTRNQTKIKPPTSSLDAFELTQNNYKDFLCPTQAHFSSKKVKLPKMKPKKIQPSELQSLHERRSNDKLNSILLSSSEEDDLTSDSDSQSTNIDGPKTNSSCKTPSDRESPVYFDDLICTPQILPKLPSDLLSNSEFLDKINSSQPGNSDDLILDFKAEEEEVTSQLTARASFKRHAGNYLQGKNKRLKMKYASDDDD